ncbi:hypothetical protein PInf_020605 [Phytophthora infestans]|nr:hypothetical protein PInf_020605 [Phytophthora infestans]
MADAGQPETSKQDDDAIDDGTRVIHMVADTAAGMSTGAQIATTESVTPDDGTMQTDGIVSSKSTGSSTIKRPGRELPNEKPKRRNERWKRRRRATRNKTNNAGDIMDHSDRTDKDDGNSTDKRTTALNSGTTSTGSGFEDARNVAAGKHDHAKLYTTTE